MKKSIFISLTCCFLFFACSDSEQYDEYQNTNLSSIVYQKIKTDDGNIFNLEINPITKKVENINSESYIGYLNYLKNNPSIYILDSNNDTLEYFSKFSNYETKINSLKKLVKSNKGIYPDPDPIPHIVLYDDKNYSLNLFEIRRFFDPLTNVYNGINSFKDGGMINDLGIYNNKISSISVTNGIVTLYTSKDFNISNNKPIKLISISTTGTVKRDMASYTQNIYQNGYWSFVNPDNDIESMKWKESSGFYY